MEESRGWVECGIASTKGFCPKVARRVAGAHTSDCAWKSSAIALLGNVSSVWQCVQVFVANPNKTPAIVTILVQQPRQAPQVPGRLPHRQGCAHAVPVKQMCKERRVR